MIGQKADVIFQVAGLSGAGAIEAACATPGVIGIGVDVDQSKSLPQSAKCILTSAEKKLVDAVSAAIGKVGAGTDVGGTAVWDASTDPVGVGLSPFGSDYKDLVTPEIQAKIDAALAGMKDGTRRPMQADRLRQQVVALTAGQERGRAGIASARLSLSGLMQQRPEGNSDRGHPRARDARDHQALSRRPRQRRDRSRPASGRDPRPAR